MKKTYLLVLMSLMMLLGACSDESEVSKAVAEDTTKLDEIKEEGKIVIATGNYYPFEYLDSDSNELVGYDIDLGNRIGEHLGVEVEWKEMQFQALIPSIQNDQVDLVIAAMYITDERKEVVDFANPYLSTGMVLVRHKTDDTVQTTADLSGKKVGVKAGATSEQAAQKLKDEGLDIEIVSYKETVDYLMDLELGRIDVAINDYLNQLGYFESYPDSKLQITGDPFTESNLGMAVEKGETALIDAINEVLVEMESNGEKQALFDKWIDKK